ncbi:MAG: two-component regulator propeller domain-containing protein, partial [bacterium]
MHKLRKYLTDTLLRLSVVVSTIFSLSASGLAQHYTFRNYTGDDGLSQLSCQALFQDRDGYIWLGTQAGLNCFDGDMFETFGIRQGLANDWINAIKQDSTGRMWIGTNGGLSCWDGKGFINHTPDNGLRNKYVQALAIDSLGNVWCGTRDGLSRWNGRHFRNYDNTDGIPKANIRDLLIDQKSRLWVATDFGLYYQDGEQFVQFENPTLKESKIYRIARESGGRLWVGMGDRLVAFEGLQKVSEYTAKDGLHGFPV